mmetsp:Transcript_14028/g.32613  ORF Transcript_14028/g.32613 Transcript_14028/m.32613 type:complete len:595 (-) Transcript_14028:714-2498(-)|eukprot:CAMPEP_0197180242 /NCGR_PEP_ID=MMETSP1423-20130617/4915_1 /TAXON_ID=476441 /ORGANISM="Pseudo-nitzschia heimii, Strain UNC1101" /LENGTH=594 /DNA_ID=CAMNT_0042630285 /DNA_START=77 /DNA_END=1861 /DNA_ORIENTATION=+
MSPKEYDAVEEDAGGGDGVVEDDDAVVRCDYLVVGAGTAGMSFVDTMLTEHPTVSIALVDRNSRPGGHWTKAYPYVRLHQYSCNYGVNSTPLGSNRDRKGNERFDVTDRASKDEILEYYDTVRRKFESTGRVRCFFDSEYSREEEEEEEEGDGKKKKKKVVRHVVTTATTGESDGGGSSRNRRKRFVVECRRKVVTILSDVTVPSMRKPLIPVDETVREDYVPPNEIPDRVSTGRYDRYVVFGCGKTGMDAIVYLINDRKIDPDRITWIVSRDLWFLRRDKLKDMWEAFQIFKRGFEADSVAEAFLGYERDGIFCRRDPNGPAPTIIRGAIIDDTEIEAIRSVTDVVHGCHATAVSNDGRVVMEDDRKTFRFDVGTTLLIDCMVDNVTSDAVLGYDFDENLEVFESDRINLGPLFNAYNPSLTSALVAFMECSKPDDDDLKNRCVFFLRGRYTKPTLGSFFGAYLMELKSTDAIFRNFKGAVKFLLNSRTNDLAPMHHKGGLLKFLWMMHGPAKLSALAPTVIEKAERRGWSDVDHAFGIETFSGFEQAELRKTTPRWWRRRCFGKKTKTKKPSSSSSSETAAAPGGGGESAAC